jgi:hypothetical protein
VNRTQGLKIFSLALSQLSYQGLPSEGIEPSTLGLLDPRSNQLSYEGIMNSPLEKLTYNKNHTIMHNHHFTLKLDFNYFVMHATGTYPLGSSKDVQYLIILACHDCW